MARVGEKRKAEELPSLSSAYPSLNSSTLAAAPTVVGDERGDSTEPLSSDSEAEATGKKVEPSVSVHSADPAADLQVRRRELQAGSRPEWPQF